MAFPSTLSLSTVCNAYGKTPKILAGLAGSVYYTNDSNVATGTIVSIPVSLHNFSGNYISANGTLADQSPGNQDVIYFGYGNQSVTNMSYVMTNGILTKIKLTWNLSCGNRNGGLGTTTNSDAANIQDNHEQITSFSPANNTYTFDISVPTGHTFSIFIFANVQNAASGQQNSMSNTWTYNVSATGLSGPI